MFSKISRFIDRKVHKITQTKRLLSYQFHVPPGHFYSPLVDKDLVRRYQDDIFKICQKEIVGIDLREEAQLVLLEKLLPFYQEMPFRAENQSDYRYYYENEYYSYSDAVFLHCLMRHLQPKRVIEIGSGFSSAMMLDTNQRFFEEQINLTFIEPYPERLQSTLRPSDNVQLREQNIQDISPKFFDVLEENDILFVDTSHIVKTGSDVNYILFNIIPRLKKGVYIHFHDVFFPFEYPRDWVLDMNRSWNEDYLLRAFLMHNSAFEIRLFSTFLHHYHADWLKQHMPLTAKNEGACLWMQKVQ